MRTRRKGFSLIELLIVVAIILIIAAIAIPNLLRARMAANEASAVSSLRTLNTACITYNSTYGGYPPRLDALGPPAAGVNPDKTKADMIDQVLAGTLNTATKSGYTITYTPAPPDINGNIPAYTINADPLVVNQTGLRQFFTDQSGVMRFRVGGPASASDPPLQ